MLHGHSSVRETLVLGLCFQTSQWRAELCRSTCWRFTGRSWGSSFPSPQFLFRLSSALPCAGSHSSSSPAPRPARSSWRGGEGAPRLPREPVASRQPLNHWPLVPGKSSDVTSEPSERLPRGSQRLGGSQQALAQRGHGHPGNGPVPSAVWPGPRQPGTHSGCTPALLAAKAAESAHPGRWD